MTNERTNPNPDFLPTGQAGDDWYLCNDHAPSNKLELIANGVPIALISLDLYEDGDFSEIEQAKANAQVLVNAHNLLNVVKLCEEALSDADVEKRFEALKAAQDVLAKCSTYTGPEPHLEQTRHQKPSV